MLNKYLKIRGSIGIEKGLGLDEVEIDFSTKDGLIALAGPNGRGKTTVLELMSPFRTFASRKGALRHHFNKRDSMIENKFSFNGNEYHLIRKIDCDSDRAEAFIIKDGESVVNGKLKEYDKYITDLFGSQALFYNSVFCAQGSGNFADMTTGEIKELFVEFLRLEKLAEYESISKEALKFYASKHDIVTTQINSLKEQYGFLDKQEALDGLIMSNLKLKGEADTLNEYIKSKKAEIEALKERKLLASAEIEKREGLQKQIDALEFKMNEIKTELLHLKTALKNELAGIEGEKYAYNSIIKDKDAIESGSVQYEMYQDKFAYYLDCFECALSRKTTLTDALEDMQRSLRMTEEKVANLDSDPSILELIGKLESLEENRTTLKTRSQELSYDVDNTAGHYDSMISSLMKDIDRAEKDIAFAIDPACTSTICPALNVVADARKNLPDLKLKLSNVEIEKLSELGKLDDKLDNYIQKLDLAVEEINQATEIKKVKEVELSRERDQFIPIIQKYEEKINELIEEINFYSNCVEFYSDSRKEFSQKADDAKNMADRMQKLTEAISKVEFLKEKAKTADHNTANAIDKLDNRLIKSMSEADILNTEVGKLKAEGNQFIDVGISRAGIKIDEYQKQLGNTEELMQNQDRNISVLEHEIELDKKNRVSIDKKEKLLSKISKEIADWTYLKLACSKTGLQALEIDGAAPLITREANQLLEMTFGLDFQIKIETLDPESGKEVFWVKVIRADGSEDKFGDLSGGQKVWIAKALSLGMTLVSKRKSGKAFQTLFADEEDGALDAEKALDFINLYRSMMSSGEFNACLYISHNPEVVAMADHILDFSGKQLIWR